MTGTKRSSRKQKKKKKKTAHSKIPMRGTSDNKKSKKYATNSREIPPP